MATRILLVGHCDIDGPRLQQEISAQVRGADVLRVNSTQALRHQCEQGADLLLVNREPVGFDESGMDLIRDVRSDYPDAKVVLVSDHEDAQEEAVEAGALPGFGKRLIGSPELGQAVRQALA